MSIRINTNISAINAHRMLARNNEISARNLEQLQPCLDSLNIKLTDIVYQKINDITRTPPPATDRIEEVN